MNIFLLFILGNEIFDRVSDFPTEIESIFIIREFCRKKRKS
ncbi:hypothetical protein FH5_04760 [Priestia endophytica]|nr:hypothetical protein FH5_04760 [Priestia endophytica]